MEYISTKEAAAKWDISEHRSQKLCEEGRIDGVVCFSRVRAILKDAQKPVDTRRKHLHLTKGEIYENPFIRDIKLNFKKVLTLTLCHSVS